jgi:hypothetical protein
MGWLQKLFGKEEQKPAETSPSVEAARSSSLRRQESSSAQKPLQTWPKPGQPTAIEKALGAKPMNPATWKTAATGTTSHGVPKAVTQAMPPEFAKAIEAGPPKPSFSELQVLQGRGWGLPADAIAEELPSPFKTDDPRSLVSYSYTPRQEEVDRIEELYRGMPGYTAPEKVTSEVPKVGYYGGLGVRPEHLQEDVLGKGKNPSVAVEQKAAALTWDAYDKLTPDQRAAVDFNTLLVAAREKDLGISYAKDPFTGEQKQQYDADVKEIFGDEGGSEKFAPNTVALLKQINLKALGQDLDEFLSLERAFTADELKDFKIEDLPELKQLGDGANYSQARSIDNREVLDATIVQQSSEAITKAMTNANMAMQDFYSTMQSVTAPAVTAYGGSPIAVEAAPGFPFLPATPYQQGNEADMKSQVFNMAYATAASGQMDKVWEIINEEKWDQADIDELFSYMDQRSRQELRWGRPAGMFVDQAGDEPVTFLSPEATRSAIGFGD